MRIINKFIIASYAEVILDIMEHNSTKENTKNIRETLGEIYAEWDDIYDYGRLPMPESEAKEYVEIGLILDKLTTIAREYVDADDYLDFDNNDMVYGLIQLIRLGKEEK